MREKFEGWERNAGVIKPELIDTAGYQDWNADEINTLYQQSLQSSPKIFELVKSVWKQKMPRLERLMKFDEIARDLNIRVSGN